METVHGKWKMKILALSPKSKYGLPRLAMAIPRLMPKSRTLFMVCYVYVENSIAVHVLLNFDFVCEADLQPLMLYVQLFVCLLNKVDTTNRCEALNEVMPLKYV